MYIPKHYKENDIQEIKSFMLEHQFVTIITNDGDKPIATHVPINIHEKNGEIYVTGHLAKNNDQWRLLNKASNVLIIFQGPHAYISSTWYEKEDVPTWNYQSVHVYGDSRLLSESELIEDLTYLLNKYEGHRENGATWDNMSENTRKQINGIIGFEIEVKEIQAAYKLSQTRTEQDKNNIISKLKESGDHLDIAIAKIMNRE
ncbi:MULTISPECIES: FMN-binding negative transcriptional regulator [Mammaliicoccus]|uniref:FMN-binding negative transcriptional regulator n=1 Tax=Mammaliicoccus TaxID=2803850 RepID=UPI000D1CF0AE|nr:MULTISPECIES: FMN-binding negative transcriptional regulator [Mammaliicoccus]HCN60034.1 protease [Staphylococcus sp.]MBW0764324.1 FMN-binding negative transcriptional regulator [Mammaliicoccus fleurettii]MEB6202378.1 FMN-binding negative transcriptional regulator [Mammaliicoccus fleurettii]MEB7807305.1 FMN-binding negative transcriptional regulator [Mammaliicoccus fleurettii]PTE34093.1 protease [Mammaliicoccus fleurettii]